MANAKDTKVAPGTPAHEDPQAQKEAAETQKVHEEAAERRTAGPFANFDNYDDAAADLEEKRQKLTEATLEAQAAEQSLPDLKIALEQKRVEELKQQEPQYGEDGRLLGVGVGARADEDPQPVSLPQMYGGVVDPQTIRGVH